MIREAILFMNIQAHLGNLRISPRKVRVVAAMLKGLSVRQADVQLDCELRRAAHPLRKLLRSAVSNAENNYQSVRENLIVDKVLVNEGKKLKRWLPRAQGRATPIWKRMSEVRLTLREVDPSVKSSHSVSTSDQPLSVNRKLKTSQGTLSKGSDRLSSVTAKRGASVRAARSAFHRKSV